MKKNKKKYNSNNIFEERLQRLKIQGAIIVKNSSVYLHGKKY